jgi:energy-converting hydrogenase Eha subunit B
VRPQIAVPAAAVLVSLVVWFGVELAADRGYVGLSERAAAGAQAIWPLATVVIARRELARRRRNR